MKKRSGATTSSASLESMDDDDDTVDTEEDRTVAPGRTHNGGQVRPESVHLTKTNGGRKNNLDDLNRRADGRG